MTLASLTSAKACISVEIQTWCHTYIGLLGRHVLLVPWNAFGEFGDHQLQFGISLAGISWIIIVQSCKHPAHSCTFHTYGHCFHCNPFHMFCSRHFRWQPHAWDELGADADCEGLRLWGHSQQPGPMGGLRHSTLAGDWTCFEKGAGPTDSAIVAIHTFPLIWNTTQKAWFSMV